jgi:hypothetical protein
MPHSFRNWLQDHANARASCSAVIISLSPRRESVDAETPISWAASAAVWAIIPLNAVMVSTSANGAYVAILRAKNGKTE